MKERYREVTKWPESTITCQKEEPKMPWKTWTCFACIAILAGAHSWHAAAQESVSAIPDPVTEHHEVLKKDAGVWDAEVTIWPQGPQAEPLTSPGVETNRIVGGGLWLISDFKGSVAGQTFEGHGQFGYDPIEKKYVGTWVDSMSPFLNTMEGTYDASTQTLTMISEGRDPQTGKTVKSKSEARYVDEDHRIFTMSMANPANPSQFVKVMQIDYTRRRE